MTPLDHAIASMTKEVACYGKQCDQLNFARRQAELWGFEDVRDGVTREQREVTIHHVELLYLYREAWQTAMLLAGKQEA